MRGAVDLLVNFISLQEVEPPVVGNYLHQVDLLQTRSVLLRNLREGKQARRGPGTMGVDVHIRADDYVGMPPGYELVDRKVRPFGFRNVDGFHFELLLPLRWK